MTPEAELIERVVARDPGAETAFVERYQGLILGLARGRLGLDADDANELMQATFERLWEDQCRALRAWRGQGRFTTYLTVIVLRLGYKIRRGPAPTSDADPSDEKVPGTQPGDDQDPAAEALRRERRRLVRTALATLSPRDRLLLALRFFDERAPTEIAALLGRTPGATRKAVHDALARLRRVLRRDRAELFQPDPSDEAGATVTAMKPRTPP